MNPLQTARTLQADATAAGCYDVALDDCLDVAEMWNRQAMPLDTPVDRMWAVSEIKARSICRRATMSVTDADNEPPLPIFAGTTPPDFDSSADECTAVRVWEHATGDGVWVRVYDNYDTSANELNRLPAIIMFDHDVAETAEDALALASALTLSARIIRGDVA